MENRINYMIELENAISKKMTGKMTGIQGLTTSCLENPICKKRMENNNTVCANCYAVKYLKSRKNVREKYAANTELLTKHEFTLEEVPFINAQYFRFESFGEIQNMLQVKNYFTICNKNPDVNFALWSKNIGIINDAIQKYRIKKPANLNIVYSESRLNHVHDKNETIQILSIYPFVDKIFTVYDKNHAEDVKINCGKKRCMDCLKCYKKSDKTIHINEMLK